jgi:hypothetical protein
MKKVLFLSFFSLIMVLNGRAFCDAPDWSIIIYAATDADDLYKAEASLEALLKHNIPQNVELLIEWDSHKNPVKRFIKRNNKIENDILPEADSASTYVFKRFLNWANKNAQGKKRLFVDVSHSWGWKGIIQDYNVPDKPSQDTMMLIKEFREAFIQTEFNMDIMFLDGCILGTTEVLEDLEDTVQYIVVSQRETPYGGFPFLKLFEDLKQNMSVKELARLIPLRYVEAYSHDGSMAQDEGEYDVVTAVTVDLYKWKLFSDKFRYYVSLLAQNGFRERLAKNYNWFENIIDVNFENGKFSSSDYIADLVELIKRIPAFMNNEKEIVNESKKLLDFIDYPEAISDQTEGILTIENKNKAQFELLIEADPFINIDEVGKKVLDRWLENNHDLLIDYDFYYDLIAIDSKNYFVIKGAVNAPFKFRPWLPGVKNIIIETQYKNWARTSYTKEFDYFYTTEFPESSFLVSEAHTQGVPFIHGIGIMMKPHMKRNEIRGENTRDPSIKGQDYYKSLSWNQNTGWGDLILIYK